MFKDYVLNSMFYINISIKLNYIKINLSIKKAQAYSLSKDNELCRVY